MSGAIKKSLNLRGGRISIMNDATMKIFIGSLTAVIIWFLVSQERLNSSAQWALNLIG